MIYLWVGLFLAGFAAGFGIEHKLWSAADDARLLADAQSQVVAAQKTAEVVTQYVDRIQTVNVPVPVIRRVLVDRVCPASGAPVPGSAGAVAAGAVANAGDSFADQLSAELPSCEKNAEQLHALISWVRINSAQP